MCANLHSLSPRHIDYVCVLKIQKGRKYQTKSWFEESNKNILMWIVRCLHPGYKNSQNISEFSTSKKFDKRNETACSLIEHCFIISKMRKDLKNLHITRYLHMHVYKEFIVYNIIYVVFYQPSQHFYSGSFFVLQPERVGCTSTSISLPSNFYFFINAHYHLPASSMSR